MCLTVEVLVDDSMLSCSKDGSLSQLIREASDDEDCTPPKGFKSNVYVNEQ